MILSQLDSTVDPRKVLGDLPQDMKCSDIADFLRRALIHSNDTVATNRMRALLELKIIENLGAKLAKNSSDSIVINEDTTCRHCSQVLGKEDVAFYPDSKLLAHKSCHVLYGSHE